MCGIIGVCSARSRVSPIVAKGLKRLEYRGYDSVGVAILHNGALSIWKSPGDVDNFLSKHKIAERDGLVGMGHTRWATHGPPNEINAHPHLDCKGEIAVVHNGVIRNFQSIKDVLILRGHRIKSDTDTELIAHLIEDELHFSRSMIEALYRAVSRLEGSYAIAVAYSREPNRLYFARQKSPLIVGVGEDISIVASDLPAMVEHTRNVIILEDGEIGWIEAGTAKIFKVTDAGLLEVPEEEIRRRITYIEWSPEEAEKLGYPHFMLKEIVEQPITVKSTFEGNVEDPVVRAVSSLIAESKAPIIVGAGTSYHAGLALSYYLASIAKIKSIPVVASEHKFMEGLVDEDDLVIAISQSGETYDTLEAVRSFKARGSKVVGITNVVGSALSRESDLVIYMRSGPEIGVAATKTFTSQLIVVTLLALLSSLERGVLKASEVSSGIKELSRSPDILQKSIERSLSTIGDAPLKGVKSMYVLGRGLGNVLAKEASLKIKEISYVHAESYPAGESKHGPIALVEPSFPVYFVATSDSPEIGGNVAEMLARGASVTIVKPEDVEVRGGNARAVSMPSAGSILLEPYSLIPYFQILAYKESVARGYNPDKPRNLAKTVTVE